MKRSWAWLALLEERPEAADAAAEVSELDGAPAGVLAAWCEGGRPDRAALRADARAIDPDGPAGWLSLVLHPPGVRLLFDDLAVQQARRAVLAGPPADVVTTLLSDASHFEGSLTVRRGGDAPRRLRDDPFGRVFPARVLRVGAGLLAARTPAPAGPVIERYGSSEPWPRDRFPG